MTLGKYPDAYHGMEYTRMVYESIVQRIFEERWSLTDGQTLTAARFWEMTILAFSDGISVGLRLEKPGQQNVNNE